MNTLKFQLVALLCYLPLMAFAQLTVQENGKVEIGQEQNLTTVNPELRDTVSTLKLYGTGANGANARIAFGNASSIHNLNVMIGELPGGDTDKLWLHGKNGFSFTTGDTAQTTICSYNTAGGPLRFNTSVAAPGFILLVEDSASISERSMNTSSVSLDGLSASRYTKNGRISYGFELEDVQDVIPELVVTDQNGNYGIDYISCIPLLVNAINDLKEEIAELKGTQRAQKSRMTGINNIETTSESIVSELYQNAPNPFSSTTTIRYSLSEGVQQANIYIYDLQGKQVKNIPLNDRGMSQVSINGYDLQAGMYIYTLIADNQEVDSKRMILTK